MSPTVRVGVALAAALLLAAGTHAKDCRHTDVTLPPKVASIRPECRTLELRVMETDSSFELAPGEVGYFRKVFGPDGIADQGAVALAKLLRETRGNGPPVTSLTLVGMSDGASAGYTPGIDVDILDDGATALANLLPEVPIAHLDLSNNAVGLKGALALATALRDPRCRLTSLYLSKNLIDDRGVTALAEAIAESPTNRLEKLNLKSSNITDAGAVALAAALKSPHCKLKLLHLQRCHITDVGGQVRHFYLFIYFVLCVCVCVCVWLLLPHSVALYLHFAPLPDQGSCRSIGCLGGLGSPGLLDLNPLRFQAVFAATRPLPSARVKFRGDAPWKNQSSIFACWITACTRATSSERPLEMAPWIRG